MDQQNEQIRSDASRWGGAALALGTLAYVIAVVSYVALYGRPDRTAGGEPTLADRVAHLQGRWRLAQTLWFVETLAALLIAVAGFVLQDRAATAQTRLPPRVAWATVGVGALLLSLMYPFMLGGYPSAAGAFREEPALFAVINGIATFIFNLGNAVVFVGLAGAFATEATSRGAVPRGIALLGVALCLLSTIVAFGMFIGVVAMSSAAPLGLVVFALAVYLGLAIWRQGEPTRRVRQKPPRDSGV